MHAEQFPTPTLASMKKKATLITRGGVVMAVRPVLPTDETILEIFFDRVSAPDLRHRFLSSMSRVDRERILSMVDVDYDRTISFLAFDATGEVIATAMVAADEDRKGAEIALAVRSDMKGRGVGWTLLQHVLHYCRARGFEQVRSLESRENGETIALERDAGFSLHACEGDPTNVEVIKDLTGQTA